MILQIRVKLIQWSCDPRNGISDDPMIWGRFKMMIQWSLSKLSRDPWVWSQPIVWSGGFDPEISMIQFLRNINSHDHVSIISAISMIRDFYDFRPWSLNAEEIPLKFIWNKKKSSPKYLTHLQFYIRNPFNFFLSPLGDSSILTKKSL